ncbi:MAG: polysaccharide biosynthesis/export family protein [Planctomyces sp.]|nr:polysaccharide biosynthesis/export family protein [Planctomyces sp.]
MSRRTLLPAILCSAAFAGALASSGCTSISTQATHCDIPAVPARMVPHAYLGRARSEMQQLSFTRLRQNPTDVYQVGPGDVLLLHVPGVYPQIVSSADQQQVRNEERVVFQIDANVPPAEGVPVIVREDGSIALRSIDPIQSTGLTLEQLAEVIRRAYLDADILLPGNDRVIVNIYSRRKHRIMVIREDVGSGGNQQGRNGIVVNSGAMQRGSGTTVELPAYENDVLHALTATGGLPGLDAENEVVVIRGGFDDGAAYDQLVSQIMMSRQPCECPPSIPDPPNVMRIPLRFYPEMSPQFTEEDIILEEGDVVYVPSRQTDKFYTGGVLPGGEFLLPRDYDLDVMGAIAMAHGPLGGGGSGLSAIGGRGGMGMGMGGGNRGGMGGGLPPTNLIVLRKLPCGGQIPIRVDLKRALLDQNERILVQPGDTLILRYTLCEEIYNTAIGLFSINYLIGPALR